MKRSILGNLTTSLFIFAYSAEQTSSKAPDPVVLNANVRALDSTLPRVQAFAIDAGKFVAPGSDSEIQPLTAEFVFLGKKLPAEIDRRREDHWVAATYLAAKQVYPKTDNE